jgi:hypothetical protein
MIISGIPPAGGVPRSSHAQSSRKLTMVMAASLLLGAFFVLAGAPAAPVALAFTGNHTTSILHPSLPCGGDKPGICPDSPSV